MYSESECELTCSDKPCLDDAPCSVSRSTTQLDSIKFITHTFLGLFSGLTPHMIWISAGEFLFFGAFSSVKVTEDPRL